MSLKPVPVLLLCLGLALNTGQLPAADVAYFGMAKGQQFEQPVGGVPALLVSNAFTFQSLVVASTNDVMISGAVKPSTSTPTRQLTSEANSVVWRFADYANTQAQLDSVYPAGSGFAPTTYTFTMQTSNDGTRTVSLNFWLLPPLLAISSPPTPQIHNLAAAQEIDHTRDFTLRWNSLGGSALMIVQLTVLDSASNLVFASAVPFQPGALTGASTSIVLPAFALPSGAALIAHLTAANPGLPNTNGYPGAMGIATLAKDTQFPMATRPAPMPPRLELVSVTPVQVQLLATQLETNRLYHLQRGTNFANWFDIAATNPVGATVQIADSPPAGLGQLFYRLRIGQ